MVFRVVLAKSSAFRRSVAAAFEFARTGPIASIACCASASIFGLFTQSVLLLAIVVIPSFLRATEPLGIRSFTSFSQHIQESDRMSTFVTYHTKSASALGVLRNAFTIREAAVSATIRKHHP